MMFNEDTVVGTCPNCKHETVFTPTKKHDVFTCMSCYKRAKQWKNGKIHWAVISDNHPYVDYL